MSIAFGSRAWERAQSIPVPERGRLEFIDMARGLGIILVVFTHALNEFFDREPYSVNVAFMVWRYVYSFHMPLFFMISGMVYKDKGFKDVLNGALSLLFTAWTYHGIVWLGQAIISPSQADWHKLIGPLIKQHDFSALVLWFLVALAFVRIYYFLILKSGWLLRCLLGLSLSFCFVLSQMYHTTIWQIDAVLPGIAFYAFGHWVYPHLSAIGYAPLKAGLAMVGFLAVGLLAPLNFGCALDPLKVCPAPYSHGLFAISMILGSYGFLPLFIITALIGSLSLILLGQLVVKMPEPITRRLLYIGRKSLDLLMINALFMTLVEPALRVFVAPNPNGVDALFYATAFCILQVGQIPLFVLITRPVTQALSGLAATLNEGLFNIPALNIAMSRIRG